MKKYVQILLLIFIVNLAYGQNKRLSQIITLQMVSDLGKRSSAVVWHPAQKKYYVPKCGNASFSMGVFDAKGNKISPPDLEVGVDIRGLWYNSNTKKLEFNCYGDGGWGEITLDNKGFNSEVVILQEGSFQPLENNVGFFDASNNLVHFLFGYYIVSYDRATFKEVKRRQLYIDAKDDEEYLLNGVPQYLTSSPDHINSSTVIYTGIPKAEFGLLNTKGTKIDLYNAETGFLTQSLLLPNSAPLPQSFCFSYTNGIYFLYDTETNEWKGYQ